MRDYLQQACCQEPLNEKPNDSQCVKKPSSTRSVALARNNSDTLPTPCTAPDMPVKKPSGVVRAQGLSIGGHLVWAKAPLDLRMLGGGGEGTRGKGGVEGVACGLADSVQLTVIYGKDTWLDASGGMLVVCVCVCVCL
jgi:hypothetical protein